MNVAMASMVVSVTSTTSGSLHMNPLAELIFGPLHRLLLMLLWRNCSRLGTSALTPHMCGLLQGNGQSMFDILSLAIPMVHQFLIGGSRSHGVQD
jgi:hypothetical protein